MVRLHLSGPKILRHGSVEVFAFPVEPPIQRRRSHAGIACLRLGAVGAGNAGSGQGDLHP